MASIASAQSALAVLIQSQAALGAALSVAPPPPPRAAPGPSLAGLGSSAQTPADDGGSGVPEPPSRDPLGNLIDILT